MTTPDLAIFVVILVQIANSQLAHARGLGIQMLLSRYDDSRSGDFCGVETANSQLAHARLLGIMSSARWMGLIAGLGTLF